MSFTLYQKKRLGMGTAWGKLLDGLGVFAFIVIVLGPVLVLSLELFNALLAGQAEWLRLALPQGRRFTLLTHSLGLAAGVSIAGITMGVLVGSLLWRWSSGLGAIMRWFLLILAPLPPYIHALAWTSLTYEVNSGLQALGMPVIPFRGWLASWWVQLMALLPIAIGLTLLGLESVDPDMIEAARLLRPDFQGLMSIVLPLASPVILAAGGFLFLLSLTDYSVPSLFQFNVYALEIYAEYSASSQPLRAFLTSIPLLLIAGAIVVGLQIPLRNAALRPPWKRHVWSTPPSWPSGMIFLQRGALVILIAQILVLLLSQALLVGSWQNLHQTILAAQEQIAFTAWVGAISAVLCLPLALPMAHRLLQQSNTAWLWWALVMIPLAIPAPLVGIGLISIWNRPALPGVYGTSLMPILAALARFTPLATIILLTQLRRIDPGLIEAAQIFQASALHAWLRVRLPMLAPGLLAAASLVLVLSVGELGATLIVVPPGQSTLTLRIYNFLHYGASDTVAGLCLIITLSVLVLGALAVIALAGWWRLTSHQGDQ